MLKNIIVVLVTVVVFGCTGTPVRDRAFISGVSAETKDGAAVVYGRGGGAGGSVTFLLSPVNKDIDLLAVDGKGIKAAAPGREYWIVPGTYKLTLWCNVREVLGHQGSAQKTVKVTLEPDHFYKLHAYISTVSMGVTTCFPSVRDVTRFIKKAG